MLRKEEYKDAGGNQGDSRCQDGRPEETVTLCQPSPPTRSSAATVRPALTVVVNGRASGVGRPDEMLERVVALLAKHGAAARGMVTHDLATLARRGTYGLGGRLVLVAATRRPCPREARRAVARGRARLRRTAEQDRAGARHPDRPAPPRFSPRRARRVRWTRCASRLATHARGGRGGQRRLPRRLTPPQQRQGVRRARLGRRGLRRRADPISPLRRTGRRGRSATQPRSGGAGVRLDLAVFAYGVDDDPVARIERPARGDRPARPDPLARAGPRRAAEPARTSSATAWAGRAVAGSACPSSCRSSPMPSRSA